MNLKKSFLDHCDIKNYEINNNQLKIIDYLKEYYEKNFNEPLLQRIFKPKNYKPGFYLFGDVGVGKTMILNFFFEEFKKKKLRLHFNEFMLTFHDFIFSNKDKFGENSIEYFVRDLKGKAQLLYFDEFQVTNIADAMILGKLFKKIFEDKIKVIFSSNIKIRDLYKDGLQREQFLPFLDILEINTHEVELLIQEDYRISRDINLRRFLSPLNTSNNFLFNKFLRKITKNKTKDIKLIEVKGRKIKIENYFEGIAKFDFDDLCNRNIGSEDYIKIAEVCNFILIENLSNFSENNFNQQQRFITFIDIIYEKKIPLMITSQVSIDDLSSSKSLKDPFKRTVSRLYELTSMSFN